MKVFEIHITGEKGINEELDNLAIKNIIVELLTPDSLIPTVLRTEYMSSFIYKCEKVGDVFEYVHELVNKLKTKIIRVKIECPAYESLFDMSLYMESHFPPMDSQYPISRNQRSQKLMATSREYDKSKYADFIKKWDGHDVELCILDSFKEEDFDWFNLYEKQNELQEA